MSREERYTEVFEKLLREVWPGDAHVTATRMARTLIALDPANLEPETVLRALGGIISRTTSSVIMPAIDSADGTGDIRVYGVPRTGMTRIMVSTAVELDTSKLRTLRDQLTWMIENHR